MVSTQGVRNNSAMNRAHFDGSSARICGRSPRGFTLVEILVAIIVLSFGVLGMVGLQAAAMQSNRSARNQSTAVALGRELADVMRGNKGEALLQTAANPYVVDYTGALSPTPPVDCVTRSCGTNEMGRFDMWQWLSRVEASLPQPRVVVCFDDTPYNSDTGRPQWDCHSDAKDMLVVKIGWTDAALGRTADSPSGAPQRVRGGEVGLPTVVLPLVAGSTE